MGFAGWRKMANKKKPNIHTYFLNIPRKTHPAAIKEGLMHKDE